ncbi:MAG: hypothetical protein Q8L08_07115 [Candidatus Nanopelagicaceae bacterium]|nr:hypothetical protein [Candidatus Nanopelagicaceae bacterium]
MTHFKFENAEDQKLEVLAKATLRRTGATQAAALRDSTGRTYVARNVSTTSFVLDAMEAVFTVAMASQIEAIEAVVVVGNGSINLKPVREHTPGSLIWVVKQNGEIESL